MKEMNQYIIDFSNIMNKTTTYSKDGNGAFVHSCHTHCEAQGPDFNKFKVNGVSIQQVALVTIELHLTHSVGRRKVVQQ